jgi:hypothetical protein
MSYSFISSRGYGAKLVLAVALVTLTWRGAPAQVHRSQLFKRALDFGRIEMMALEGGRTVIKIPEAADAREVVVVGAIRIHVPLDALVDRFRDAESLFAGDGIVTQIGAIDGQLTLEQLQGLRLPEGDFEALSQCEVGDCKVKLTREWIEAMGAIDWSSPGHRQLAAATMVKALDQYLDAYLAGGNAGLPVYHDKSRPLAASEDFSQLHARSLQYLHHAVELWDHMAQFPERRPQGIEDRFFWMVEDFGLRPVTSLNHMMIAGDSVAGNDRATVVVKQIYASHYLQSLVKVATLVPASERYPLRGTYLVLSAQLRFDSKVGGFKRLLLKRELENKWAQSLEKLRGRAEALYRRERAASTQDG